MLYTVETNKSLEAVDKGLHEAAARHKFGILTVHDLKQTMAKKGVEFDHECRIYEVCNPHQAQKVLTANMEISNALPCRISVYTKGSRVVLSTMKPTVVLQMFEAPDLTSVAREVEMDIVGIMNEAAKE